jgi:tetratricopeptide (TPR) repeat protein
LQETIIRRKVKEKQIHTIIFCFLLCIFSGSLKAQNDKIIDSLNSKAFEMRDLDPEKALLISGRAIRLAGTDTLQPSYIMSLRNAGVSLRILTRYEESIHFLQRALSLSEITGDSAAMSGCMKELFLPYRAFGNMRQAKQFIYRSLEIDYALKDTASIASGINHLASFYYEDGLFDQSLVLFQKAAEMAILGGDSIIAGNAFNNAAAIYYQFDNAEKSILFYQKALEIFITVRDYPGIALAHANIALPLLEIGQSSLAMEHVLKSITLFERINDQNNLAFAFGIQADVYRSMDSIEKAEQVFFHAMNLAMETGNYLQLANGFYRQALFYLSVADTLQAIESFQNSLEFSRELEYMVMVSSTLTYLIELYEGLGMTESAFHYLRELHSLDYPDDLSYQDHDSIILQAESQSDNSRITLFRQLIIYAGVIVIIILMVLSISLAISLNKLKKKILALEQKS